MSISVEGQKCPVCKGYMFDDEDIVFCPVCGVPTHRECYNFVGKCPLEEYHGTDMQYSPPELKEETKEEPQKTEKFNENEKINFSETEAEFHSPFAGANGTPFAHFTVNGFDPYGGINKDDRIDGVTAEEMKNTVVANTQYYLPKFFSLNKQKKTSWNWAAFLIPQSFFFYRRCHKTGVLAFLLMVAAEALMNFPMVYLTISENMTRQEIFNAFSVIFEDPQKLTFSFIATFLGLIISLVCRIIFGLYGNWIYKTHVFETVKKARENEEIEPALYIKLKGGANPFLGLFGLFGVNWIVSILFTLL